MSEEKPAEEWVRPRNIMLEAVGGPERPATCDLKCCPDKECECEDCWACD